MKPTLIPAILALLITQSATAYTFSPYMDLTRNPHWDPETQQLVPEDLIAMSQQSGARSFHLASIYDAGNCEPAWGAQSLYSVENKWAANFTKQLREQKIEYHITFGGALKNDLSRTCSDTELAAAYEKVVEVYQPKGLDFDIEIGVDANKIANALKSVQKAHPNLIVTFTVPVMPEGLGYTARTMLTAARDAKLKFYVNILAMNYGTPYSDNMSLYAINAADQTHQYLKKLYPKKSTLWNIMAITPMIGANDVEGENFTITDAWNLTKFAKQQKLAWISMRSIGRDQPCDADYANGFCSGNNLQKKPYEYSKQFLS